MAPRGKSSIPFLPYERWNASELELLHPLEIPPQLRCYKSDGNYASARLPDGSSLMWADPVGPHVVAAWHDTSPGGYVGLVDAAGHVMRWFHVPARGAPARVRDANVWAWQVCIESAKRAVAACREQQSSTPPAADSEAWLRRQLEALG